MKKFFILLAVMAFVVAGAVAIAQQAPGPTKKEKAPKEINCCIDGKCDKMTKERCKDLGGKEVSSCKKCKPPKPPKPPKTKDKDKGLDQPSTK